MILKRIENKLNTVDLRLRLLEEQKSQEETDSIKLLRHNLSTINLDDTEDYLEFSEQERREFVGRVASAKHDLEIIIKHLLKAQEDYALRQTINWEQIWTSRGTINGFDLVLEELKQLTGEHLQNVQDSKGVDSKILPS